MANFTIPSHVILGENSLEEAKDYFKKYGKKALIVTGKHVVKSEMMKQLISVLKQNNTLYEVYDGITGEPTDTMVNMGIQLYIQSKCDFVIGIGGGSPLDSAKAIAANISKEQKLVKPAVIAIPTTAGTGSEATKFSVITDTKRDVKMLLAAEDLIPDMAIVNYKFGITSPKTVTAATGLDALTHAVEAYTSRKANPLTDDIAVCAIKRIIKYLPIAFEDGSNTKAREQMAIAALEAGICINNSSVTIVHGMSRPIGALFHVPHGMSNAMLLSTCLGFAVDGAVEKFQKLAIETNVAMPDDTPLEASYRFIKKLQDVCDICEIPTLCEYGIDKNKYYELIDKMATDAVASGSPGNTVKEVTKEDCKQLYMELYK